MPKVILTGVAGVGKTTLARHLVEASTSSVYIPEDYRRLFEASHGDSDEQIALKLRHQALDWLRLRLTSCVDAQGNFFMDRGPMDILHLFLVRPLVMAEFWQKLFLAVQQSLRSVDLIVVPLLESMSRDDLDSFNDSGIKREVKPLPDIRNQAVLIGLCQQLVPAQKLLLLPREPCSTEVRASLVQRRLDALAKIGS